MSGEGFMPNAPAQPNARDGVVEVASHPQRWPFADIPVVQADRDAAAQLYALNMMRGHANLDNALMQSRRIAEGKHDQCTVVQAFARHRLTSEAAVNRHAESGAGEGLTIPPLNPPYAEEHPLLAPILVKRARAAGNFAPEFSGQRGEDFDRGLLCAFEAVNGKLQELTDAALTATPIPPVRDGAEVEREALTDNQLRKILADEFEDQGITGYARHLLSGRCDWEWVMPVLSAMRLCHARAALQASQRGGEA